MQVCKFISAVSIAVLVNVCVSAQGSSVFEMTMPTISSPTMGSGFYMPGNSSNSIYTGPNVKSPSAASSKSTSASVAKDTEAQTAEESLSSISASDISLLSQKGLLGLLGTVFDDRSYSYDSTALYKNNSAEETNKLLKKVLSRLEEIKDGADSTSAVASKDSAEKVSVPVQNATSNDGSARSSKSNLLRFTVNGYDVLKTCRTVYISDVQKDGTFLVTGDRRYNGNGRMMNETFHILFKTKPDSADFVNYTSAAAVTQEVANPNSFLYQLAQRKGMEASRTGNFVTMRTSDPDWKLELLVDLGE